jgi:hypothetical protein
MITASIQLKLKLELVCSAGVRSIRDEVPVGVVEDNRS